MNDGLYRSVVLGCLITASTFSVFGAVQSGQAHAEAMQARLAAEKAISDDEALLPKLATPYQYITVENCYAMAQQSTMGYLDRMKWRCVPSQSDRAVICTTF